MSRRVAVVAHTHWDREWYSPFEVYRSHLVDLIDELLDVLEDDADFTQFLLDGQAAVVDDYLAVRPEAEDRLRRAVTSGRIEIGPWYCLPDEFCVSAETLVRNLQLGAEVAERAGGSSRVGYLPDMFGHAAQMPQILAQSGLDVAVVWRGVPAAVGRTAFVWEAPDGTAVRAEYLPVGYSNGAFLPKDPDDLVRRVKAHVDELGDLLPRHWPLLLMNGGDHRAVQRDLPTLLAAANSAQSDLVFEQTGLARYLAARPQDGLTSWSGEMRSGARSNVLMGVLSSRVDIKVAAARAERELERMAEPLASLWLTPGQWPESLLAQAWLEVIRNSAHDSVCGCSVDEVGRAVIHRYDSARAVAGEIGRRASLEHLHQTTGAVIAGRQDLDHPAPGEWQRVDGHRPPDREGDRGHLGGPAAYLTGDGAS